MSKSVKNRPYFKKTDIIIIAVVLIASAVGFIMLSVGFTDKSPDYAQINVNGKTIRTINLTNLDTEETITIDGNFPVKLSVSSKGVKFIESECKDKLCIHSGLISTNESAACLPAGVSVNVTSENSDIDAIAG